METYQDYLMKTIPEFVPASYVNKLQQTFPVEQALQRMITDDVYANLVRIAYSDNGAKVGYYSRQYYWTQYVDFKQNTMDVCFCLRVTIPDQHPSMKDGKEFSVRIKVADVDFSSVKYTIDGPWLARPWKKNARAY